MLPSYTMLIDIVAVDSTISEEQFRAQVGPSLAHLDGLKGAFDRSPCTVVYYHPREQSEIPFWSARAVVSISLGKQRAHYLIQLYQSIADLIMMELPDLGIEVNIQEFRFS